LKKSKITSLQIIFFSVILIIGFSLTMINIFGITQDVRPKITNVELLRFKNDVELTYEQSQKLLNWKPSDNEAMFADRVNHVVSKSLAHIEWDKFDARKYNQLIPIWENYFLYFMGAYSGIPEFERYHFTDYKRSLYRGVGICGDASMIMSEVLNKNNINNKIITFPGHVILSAQINGKEQMYDPDFGVSLPYSKNEINTKPSLIIQHYKEKGYSDKEINNLVRRYGGKYQEWRGVQHFMTNKYYFEKFAYLMKWPAPLMLIGIAILFLKRRLIKVG
jgi:hypothetical protein